MSDQAELDHIVTAALASTSAAGDLAELAEVRVRATGRKSPLTAILSGVGRLPPAERGPVGQAANTARRQVEAALDAREAILQAEELGAKLGAERVDISLPGEPAPVGAHHLITQVRREVEDIFIGLGYRIADGPEIETAFNNFTALNTPEGHPARSDSDNFYIDGHPDRLLRSQTSPVQVRVMQAQEPPVYVIAPGAVYRRDDVDATHSPMFHQLEGLAIDEGLTMAHLKGTLLHFVRALLGQDREIRLIPHFFPFTEPSVDVSVSWTDRNGQPTWLEIAGAGMVDPNVLTAVGYDPERWTGFAFGFGLDRIAMVRHGLPDLRLLFEGDLRFLEQFS